ncbi:3-oxoacyl-ACP reductase [Leifsonia xyli subsp. cynodontis DSM 46306]|uniref:SDR family NAD(P)-dependent oxidoreductase n=1 Tax=Leifsonia xyli subsp. cynodontis DSM 46306 TaxID=1389489 RepID=U3PG82_LEIXC|nr:SDR family NAD(P)-dependent oxidoreductase [Leifsonia xyli]AGW42688.1 3-oxoacyl-ACP reductase [Leifsonia xyli subsp. cynodontis DSM 46306]
MMETWRERFGARGCSSPARSPARGRSTRSALLEGARAVVLWDRDKSALARLTDRLRQEILAGRAGGWGSPPRSPSSAAGRPETSVHPHVIDVGELGAIAQTAQAVRREIGGIDILINNAGIVRGKLFWEHDNGDDIRPTMQVNALAPMYIPREFLPGMLTSPRAARIVTIAPAAGGLASPRMSVSVASKWTVIGWSDSLRLELKREEGYDRVKITTVVAGSTGAGTSEGARGLLRTPLLTPEQVVDRVWRAMLTGRPMLSLPWPLGLAKLLEGVCCRRGRWTRWRHGRSVSTGRLTGPPAAPEGVRLRRRLSR